MATVVIYTREFCGYCSRALALLQRKGVDFEEIEGAAFDPEKKREMIQKSGGRATFPQIFIHGKHVGGSDELMALEREGRLDALLNNP
jgi:glutaredoxin 3